MPTPLERDWKRVQDGDVPPWWDDLLTLETTALGMPAAPHWCYDSTWSVCDHPDLPKHVHTSARVRWLLSKGWWIEPPTKYYECYVAAHADLGHALSATDPDEALQRACELCEAAQKTP